jgi:hypothetical protein
MKSRKTFLCHEVSLSVRAGLALADILSISSPRCPLRCQKNIEDVIWGMSNRDLMMAGGRARLVPLMETWRAIFWPFVS